MLLFLLLGAIINVAVAWGFARLITTRPTLEDFTMGYTESGPGHNSWIAWRCEELHQTRVVSIWSSPDRTIFAGDIPKLSAESLIMAWATQITPAYRHESKVNSAYAWELGWPNRCVGGIVLRTDNGPQFFYATTGDPEAFDRPIADSNIRPFVYRPLWRGLIVNTLLYAFLLWLSLAAFFTLRRWQRANRNLCPNCAYPIGAGDTCTECGRPVTSRARK